ncbi:MAG: hypothetical protein K2Q97_01715 [Burkholderiaceae bacterium]|nr:hypothetical protein [Burkholderiaceae bacterium]
MAMPAFGWKLDDQQIAAVTTYARNSWGNMASEVHEDQVAKVRKKLGVSVSTPAMQATAKAAPMSRPGPATLASAATSSADNGTQQAEKEATK